jgi:hypothetical protein
MKPYSFYNSGYLISWLAALQSNAPDSSPFALFGRNFGHLAMRTSTFFLSPDSQGLVKPKLRSFHPTHTKKDLTFCLRKSVIFIAHARE